MLATAQGSNKNEITNHFCGRETLLGLGEPCAKKAKCDQQRIYNERRKEKQCIPGVGEAGKGEGGGGTTKYDSYGSVPPNRVVLRNSC